MGLTYLVTVYPTVTTRSYLSQVIKSSSLSAAMRALATKAEFDAALSLTAGKLLVVDFTATWCGP